MWRVGLKMRPAISMYSAKAAREAKMMPVGLPGSTCRFSDFICQTLEGVHRKGHGFHSGQAIPDTKFGRGGRD